MTVKVTSTEPNKEVAGDRVDVVEAHLLVGTTKFAHGADSMKFPYLHATYVAAPGHWKTAEVAPSASS